MGQCHEFQQFDALNLTLAMTQHCYAILRGPYGTTGWLHTVFDKKKDAEKAIRAAGYKYNKSQHLYLDDAHSQWAKVEKTEKNVF